jgi:predicted 3-demethylubiquinone-9 3-methyltransferase (glyoxalase superfamily)
MPQKIIPSLWFNGIAKEAINFYIAAFPDSKILSTSYYPKTAEEGLADFQQNLAGDVLTIEFELGGYHFTAVNAGPEFEPNPSVSFMLNFNPSQDAEAREHLDTLWNTLIDGGEILMPLDTYQHSQHYGWVKDKYGYTWQLMLTNPDGEPRPFIIPSLMFTNENSGRAEEAINKYVALFKDARIGTLVKYPTDTEGAKAGTIMFADFQLEGQWFAAMDSGSMHDFTFNEAISLQIFCKNQPEMDYYYENLSTVLEAEVCGWCKDDFGMSWQVVPENMDELMQRPGAFAHMMQMKKLVIADF